MSSPAIAVILPVLAAAFASAFTSAACARAPAETRSFPVPRGAAVPLDSAGNPAGCPRGWRFVYAEFDPNGVVTSVVCRRA